MAMIWQAAWWRNLFRRRSRRVAAVPVTIKCPQCDFRFATQAEVDAHVAVVHAVAPPEPVTPPVVPPVVPPPPAPVVLRRPDMVSDPCALVAVGINNCWWWIEAVTSWREFFNAVVESGANAVYIDTFGCCDNRYGHPGLAGNWQGYFHNHWEQVEPVLTRLLDAAQAANVAVVADLAGANYKRGRDGQTIESPELDDAWFLRTLRFYCRRGARGLFLCPMSEPKMFDGFSGTLTPAGWDKYVRWREYMRAEWVDALGGVAFQNEENGNPRYEVAGFRRSMHPQEVWWDLPRGTVTCTDSGIIAQLYVGDMWIDPQVRPEVMQAFVRRCRDAGAGFVEYSPCFVADNLWRRRDHFRVIGGA